MTIDFARLSAPFHPEQVSWRVGSTTQDKTKGMALAYIDSRDVQNRLDDVCGPGCWQNSYPHAGAKTVCRIEIKVGDEWVGKEDGAGDSDVEAEKGALSDAFKRAAVKWGIGRYLYDIKSPWVEIKQAGRSYVIADHEHDRLARMLAGSAVQTRDTRPASSPAPRQEASPAPPMGTGEALKRKMYAQLSNVSTAVALSRLVVSPNWQTDYADLRSEDQDKMNVAIERRSEQLSVVPA